MNDDERAFLRGHVWAVLATSRRDGTPQQSMVGYAVDPDDRIVISTKSYTAKWNNALRTPTVSLTVPDDRVHFVAAGPVEHITDDPVRAQLTADVFAALSGQDRPDPASLVPMLDDQRRTVLRLTVHTTHFHE